MSFLLTRLTQPECRRSGCVDIFGSFVLRDEHKGSSLPKKSALRSRSEDPAVPDHQTRERPKPIGTAKGVQNGLRPFASPACGRRQLENDPTEIWTAAAAGGGGSIKSA